MLMPLGLTTGIWRLSRSVYSRFARTGCAFARQKTVKVSESGLDDPSIVELRRSGYQGLPHWRIFHEAGGPRKSMPGVHPAGKTF